MGIPAPRVAAYRPMKPWDPTECETMTYRNPEGESITWLTLLGGTGRFMPPIQITSIPVPAAHGSRHLGAMHMERAVAIEVAAPGILDGREELRRWAVCWIPPRVKAPSP